MPYAMKSLTCDPARVKGMSERLIVSHYENNYGGAVKRLNAIEEQLADLDYERAPIFTLNGLKREQLIAMNSMVLHEVFFDSLGEANEPSAMQKDGLLVIDCVLLTYAVGRPPEGLWLTLSRLGAAYYFLHFWWFCRSLVSSRRRHRCRLASVSRCRRELVQLKTSQALKSRS